MGRLKNWSFKDLVKFLLAYQFTSGHVQGSHHFYNGKILGKQRVVQAILSSKERDSQSDRTMKMAVKNSGIEKRYFEEWKRSENIREDIIY